ncbi:hypothetical protein VCHA50O413_20377 [Vibrio chagasii]|nr:hypothetical protein VCHA34P114_220003 [Vibrio chagasii]CAH7006876.1 hypothetical protein VCHA50O405_10373 [Vibrio chagasii]CAH7095192.1 hypothetical protein VCHA50O402_20377 [Vibrio chagasii]CAH7146700.1 hypothetical protein VCHA50O413_20377 [Vibrio chagasii]CAH7153899.1 hypothetical protein VCHA50O387_210015 [Vibrio chagasii]
MSSVVCFAIKPSSIRYNYFWPDSKLVPPRKSRDIRGSQREFKAKKCMWQAYLYPKITQNRIKRDFNIHNLTYFSLFLEL